MLLRPYYGPPSLVLAFDIGTTYSSISYCSLEPRRVLEIHEVTRFPGQGPVSGDAKVPSVLYYDKSGRVQAAGAETLTESVTEAALINGWTKTEWWKLHLRPRSLASIINQRDDDLSPLPLGISASKILADFMQYLFQCAKTYIKATCPAFSWPSVKDSTEYIFTYPNGWEDVQQLYREAVVRAGLVLGTPEGRSHVHMLTEGEASLHFCITSLLTAETADQATPQGVVIIDAGGGTIDLTMFSMTSNTNWFQEIAPPQGRLQGSVWVTRQAKALLQRKLQGWEHYSSDRIAKITQEFDQTTNLIVKSDQEPAFLRVGGHRTNSMKYNVSFGRLRLTGQEATSLYKDSIDAIIDAFEQQQKSATMPVTTAFLIGGFSNNDWLWSQLQSYFTAKNVDIRRPVNYLKKAVTSGAVLSFIERDNYPAVMRVARATYGVVCAVPVEVNNEEHIRRKHLWERDSSGDCYVSGYFEATLHKGTPLYEQTEFHYLFSLSESDLADFGIQTICLLCYRGSLPHPKWVDEDEAHFFKVCTILVDLREAKDYLTKKVVAGEVYFELDYDVVICFGETELQAHLVWKTEEDERRVQAIVLYGTSENDQSDE